MVTNYLIADIGGTNWNFKILKKDENNIEKVFSVDLKQEDFKTFYQAVSQILKKAEKRYETIITKCVLACAGKVEKDKVTLTNCDKIINTSQIIKKTTIKEIKLMNDFEAIAYGVEVYDKSELIEIQKGKLNLNKNSLIVGVGTGFGKVQFKVDEETNKMITVASEAGHCDFSAYSIEDFELVEYIKKKLKKISVSWEDILSGRGLETVYKFLISNNGKYRKYKQKYEASEISESRKTNPVAKRTFEIMYRTLARACKNFSVDSLAEGGIYITGGVVSQNSKLDKNKFIKEFTKNTEFEKMLINIPIYIIPDYEISLIGLENYIIREEF